MFNPFKKVQARSRKQMRKATAMAFGQMAGAMLPKPARAKPRPNTTSKGAGQALIRVNAQPKVSVKPAVKAKPSTTTARSRMPIKHRASFRSLTHEAPFGSLDYKLYLPTIATGAEHALPLLVMLHGCGQTPDDFATGTGNRLLGTITINGIDVGDTLIAEKLARRWSDGDEFWCQQ